MKMLMVVVVLLMSGCSAQHLAAFAQGYADAGAGGYSQPASKPADLTWYNQQVERINSEGVKFNSVNVHGRTYNCQTIGRQTTCF